MGGRREGKTKAAKKQARQSEDIPILLARISKSGPRREDAVRIEVKGEAREIRQGR